MQTLERHPTNEVFGLLDRPQEIEGILRDVERHGLGHDEVHVIGRNEKGGARALDGAIHPPERLSEEHEFNELYGKRVEAGEFLVGIPLTGAVDKRGALEILHAHGAHNINYFGRWVVEELEG